MLVLSAPARYFEMSFCSEESYISNSSTSESKSASFLGRFQVVFSNSAWIIGDKIVRVLVGLLLTGWMSRQLGPGGFGELNYIFAVMGIFSVGVTLGLDGILVRDLSRGRHPLEALIGHALLLKGVGASLAFVLALSYVAIVSPKLVLPALLCILSYFIQSLDVYELIFHSRLESAKVVIFRFVAFCLSSVLRVVLLMEGAGVAAFALMVTFEAIIGSSLIVWSLHRRGIHGRIRPFHMTILRELLGHSLPLMVSTLGVVLVSRADLVILERFVQPDQLGFYAISPKIFDLFNVVAMALIGSTLPLLSRASEDELKNTAKSLFRILMLLGWGAILGTFVTSRWLIPLLFGSQFSSSVPILNIYVMGFLFAVLTSGRSALLTAQNFLWSIAGAQVVTSIIAMIVYHLIARIGDPWLMAIGFLVVQLVSFAIVPLMFSQIRPWVILQLRMLIFADR